MVALKRALSQTPSLQRSSCRVGYNAGPDWSRERDVQGQVQMSVTTHDSPVTTVQLMVVGKIGTEGERGRVGVSNAC